MPTKAGKMSVREYGGRLSMIHRRMNDCLTPIKVTAFIGDTPYTAMVAPNSKFVELEGRLLNSRGDLNFFMETKHLLNGKGREALTDLLLALEKRVEEQEELTREVTLALCEDVITDATMSRMTRAGQLDGDTKSVVNEKLRRLFTSLLEEERVYKNAFSIPIMDLNGYFLNYDSPGNDQKTYGLQILDSPGYVWRAFRYGNNILFSGICPVGIALTMIGNAALIKSRSNEIDTALVTMQAGLSWNISIRYE